MGATANSTLKWNEFLDADNEFSIPLETPLTTDPEPRETTSALIGIIPSLIIICCIGTVLALTYIHWAKLEVARDLFLATTWSAIFLWGGGTFLVINVAALAWRLVLFLNYKNIPACEDAELPTCTVIVPAYNESEQVLTTLQSIANSNYPKKKLQIIAVDDGSQDDTWQWIVKASKQLKGRITALKQPRNKGKREALYAGFRKSRGDVLVTIDSDSTIEPDTLRSLVSPFVVDSRVGAVAGNVRVLNQDKGVIPKMLDIVFVFSFDFIRTSQSMVNTVMCTPGALSAYRSNIVRNVLQEWLHQTFIGRPAKIGEDRAMTNLILREGYSVLFQQNAKVYTNVPTHYSNLCKMFLRWARSNVRETLVMSRFAFRRFRKGSMLGARINLLLSWLSLVKSQFFVFFTWALIVWQPLTMCLNVLLGIVISASLLAGLYMVRYRNQNALLAYAYHLFWFTSLFWITPYATLTAHRSEWLTRNIST